MKQIPGIILFKVVSGSKVYGMDVEGSDTDIKGVYIQDPGNIIRYGYVPHYRENKDTEYYELHRYMQLLSSSNITAVEMLFTPENFVLTMRDEFLPIIKNRMEFVTKQMEHSVTGYLNNIIKAVDPTSEKLKLNQYRQKKTPLSFCTVFIDGVQKTRPFYDFLQDAKDPERANPESYSLLKTEIPNLYFLSFYLTTKEGNGLLTKDGQLKIVNELQKKPALTKTMYFDKIAYKAYMKKHKAYNLLNKDDIKSDEYSKRKKVALGIRLVDMIHEVVRGGSLKVLRPNGRYLQAIKEGKVELDWGIQRIIWETAHLPTKFYVSKLPHSTKSELSQDVLEQVKNKFNITKLIEKNE